jgi:hypothetical protein
MAERETDSDALSESAEAGAHALPCRLEGLEACRPERGVDADALDRAMVDADENQGLPIRGHGGGPLGADRAVVRLRAVRAADPARRLQAVLPGQAHDATLRGPDAGKAQPRPDFADNLRRGTGLG